MENEYQYPPRFTLNIVGTEAEKIAHAHISFSGTTKRKLTTELILEPVRGGCFFVCLFCYVCACAFHAYMDMPMVFKVYSALVMTQ